MAAAILTTILTSIYSAEWISENAYEIAYSAGLLFAIIASSVLAYLMFTYRGKTPLETLLFLRECLIALIIGRIFIAITFDMQDKYIVIISWYLFCIVCGLIIFTIFKEHIDSHRDEDDDPKDELT
jgi:Ca2+/Na+ antiporter